MGCGKTTVGQKLANRLGYAFEDTDRMIVAHTSMSIPQTFEKYGETYFREIEEQMVIKCCGLVKTVVATGGGAVKTPGNVVNIMQSGIVIYLRSNVNKIYLNTLTNTNRPLLAVDNRMEVIERLLAEREPLYAGSCHFIVDVTSIEPDEAVAEIIQKLGVNP